MKFSENIRRIRRDLRACLGGDKARLLAGLFDSLQAGERLLKTGDLGFWIEQFDLVAVEDFLTTRSSVAELTHILARDVDLVENSRRVLAHELVTAAEYLMTYTTDDDFCEMESHFHWFYDTAGGFAFKESELGEIHTPDDCALTGGRRVAKRGEVQVDAGALLA